jgi:hypothetical protein
LNKKTPPDKARTGGASLITRDEKTKCF